MDKEKTHKESIDKSKFKQLICEIKEGSVGCVVLMLDKPKA